jgi:hypothetical protein
MGYRAGDTWYGYIATYVAGGGSGNASSTPTLTMNHNGVADGSFTPTVTNVATGLYLATGTIPAGYAGGDTVNPVALVTINSVAMQTPMPSFVIDRLPTILKDKAITFSFFLPLSGTNGQTPATGKTVTAKRVLDGGVYSSVSGTISETSNGYYAFAAAAADTNCTSGWWEFSASGCDTQRFPFVTEQ